MKLLHDLLNKDDVKDNEGIVAIKNAENDDDDDDNVDKSCKCKFNDDDRRYSGYHHRCYMLFCSQQRILIEIIINIYIFHAI